MRVRISPYLFFDLCALVTQCNLPEKSQQLFIENSIKINLRSFLCVNQNSLIARYWRSSNKMKVVFPSQNCRSEEHTSELQSRPHLVCRLLLEKKKREHVLQRGKA